MCIGLPAQIIETGDGFALCESLNGICHIDTMLVGEQLPGTWLLTFLNTAREILTAEKALQINAALQALDQTLQGNADIDHLFQDLVNREPQLPEFLQQSIDKLNQEKN